MIILNCSRRSLFGCFNAVKKSKINNVSKKSINLTNAKVIQTCIRRNYNNIPRSKLKGFRNEVSKLNGKNKNLSWDLMAPTVSMVFNSISKKSNRNLIVCLSARDFPATIDYDLVSFIEDFANSSDQPKVYFAITFCDSIIPIPSPPKLENNLKNFINHSISQLLNIPRFSTILLNNKDKSSIDEFFQTIIEEKKSNDTEIFDDSISDYHSQNSLYYVIGETNTGKSTIVKELMKRCRDDTNGFYDISASPCTTRSNKPHISPSYGISLVDTPGYLPKNGGIYNSLPKQLREHVLTQYPSHAESNKEHEWRPLTLSRLTQESNSETINNSKRFSSLLSIPNVFYLSIPENQKLYFKKRIYGKPKTVKILNEDISEYLNKTYKKNWKILQLPNFTGSIDLVFRGLGYITIANTLEYNNNDPNWSLYVPESLDVLIRVNIEEFIRGREIQESEIVAASLYRS
ncbi:hypothetical protein BVG19_g3818 [[Candida] boidinii]|nr:hypothetical protein BVG19_g3818 [[Candida] boidinii]OWB52255.1 hypothetical protein B5S27_g3827 [[Candida] boidinii]